MMKDRVLETEHTLIRYKDEDDLIGLSKGIGADREYLSREIDSIFCKTKKIIKRFHNIKEKKKVKMKIKLCKHKARFDVRVGAYYRPDTKEIYFYTEDVSRRYVAHEMTHAIVFACLPEVAMRNHEWLAYTVGHAVGGEEQISRKVINAYKKLIREQGIEIVDELSFVFWGKVKEYAVDKEVSYCVLAECLRTATAIKRKRIREV